MMPARNNPLTADAKTASREGQARAYVACAHAVVQARTMTGIVCEILLAEAESPTLNPAEVEAMVGNTRERIQDAMDIARVVLQPPRVRSITESLRTAAKAVQDLGAAVINARPPLIVHTVEADTNAHLLAHALYADHARAGEIVRLNPGITNPNFLRRGQRIMVYAK